MMIMFELVNTIQELPQFNKITHTNVSKQKSKQSDIIFFHHLCNQNQNQSLKIHFVSFEVFIYDVTWNMNTPFIIPQET